jgi:hypothetical protein
MTMQDLSTVGGFKRSGLNNDTYLNYNDSCDLSSTEGRRFLNLRTSMTVVGVQGRHVNDGRYLNGKAGQDS